MSIIKSAVLWYFAIAGLALHLALGAFWYLQPDLAWTLKERAIVLVVARFPFLAWGDAARRQNTDAAIFSRISEWTPLPEAADSPLPGYARIGQRRFGSVQEAADALQPGDTLDVGAGTYTTPLVVRVSGVAIVGNGHVVFEKGQAQGKANMVIAADNTRVRNIECRSIAVPDRNGACIRLEGENLTVEHVYFHDSEQGIMTGPKPGRVEIRDSRFELLGNGGQAHGIYIGGGRLFVSDSLFLAAKGEGHEIKSRAAETSIVRSVVASLNSVDSRLIDVPDGGELTVIDSVLQEGPNTSNGDLVGFALEAGLGNHPLDRVVIRNNLILIDRDLPSRLLHLSERRVRTEVSGNIVVSPNKTDFDDTNRVFRSRNAAGLPDYPALPLDPPHRGD